MKNENDFFADAELRTKFNNNYASYVDSFKAIAIKGKRAKAKDIELSIDLFEVPSKRIGWLEEAEPWAMIPTQVIAKMSSNGNPFFRINPEGKKGTMIMCGDLGEIVVKESDRQKLCTGTAVTSWTGAEFTVH